jgi:hypothetical protein
MAVEVHVAGRIEGGRFAEFVEAAGRWSDYRRSTGYVEPRLLQGLSGEMNAVVLVFEYPDLGAYEREEERVLHDEEYVGLAMAMPFDGPLHYSIFRELQSSGVPQPAA